MKKPELGDVFLFEILNVLEWCGIKCKGAQLLREQVRLWEHDAPRRRVKGETLNREQLVQAAREPMCPVLRAMTELRSVLMQQPASTARLMSEVARLMGSTTHTAANASAESAACVLKHSLWADKFKLSDGLVRHVKLEKTIEGDEQSKGLFPAVSHGTIGLSLTEDLRNNEKIDGLGNRRGRESASTTAEEAGVSNAAARASASTTAEEAGVSNATGRASASTTAKEASASNTAAQASASTAANEASASNAAGRASASTTASEAAASNAAARASASTTAKDSSASNAADQASASTTT
jgi:hypothetical protein